MSNIPSIVNFYDLIPLLHCEWYFDQCVVIYPENIKFWMEFNMTNSSINYIVNKFYLISSSKKTNL